MNASSFSTFVDTEAMAQEPAMNVEVSPEIVLLAGLSSLKISL